MVETIGALVVAVALLIGVAAHYLSHKDDSPVEQAAEAVLHVKGIDIDFSADSKKAELEKQQKAADSKE